MSAVYGYVSRPPSSAIVVTVIIKRIERGAGAQKVHKARKCSMKALQATVKKAVVRWRSLPL